MSSSAFEATLAFERRCSRVLVVAVASAWLAGGLGVMLSLHHPLAFTVVPFALIGCWIDLRRLRLGPRLWWHGGGDWRVGDPEGQVWVLDRTTWSSPWLILLVLRCPARTMRIPLARDAVDPVAWRRLRARLRISGAGAAEGHS